MALVFAAQLAAPASLVVKHEQTRAGGTLWKFQTAPVDPNDPFRGKYVRLSYAIERGPVPFADTGTIYRRPDGRMYAELAKGGDGFATLVRLHERRPEGVEYVDVFLARRGGNDLPPATAKVRMPFDRYYLPEDKAAAVERDYAAAGRDAQSNTYAEVRVRDGHAALVQLVLDGKPVQND